MKMAIATNQLFGEYQMARKLFGLKHIAGQRYREDPGLYYEDFQPGDIYEHWPGRTITDQDNIWFTNLTMNTHPLHFDMNYAASTEFGKCLVNSTLTVAVVVGMCVSSTSQKAVANLGWEKINLTAPVFAGDTLYSTTEILDKRVSRKRKDSGIVRVRHEGRNQAGEVVIDMIRSFLAPKRGMAAVDRMMSGKPERQ